MQHDKVLVMELLLLSHFIEQDVEARGRAQLLPMDAYVSEKQKGT